MDDSQFQLVTPQEIYEATQYCEGLSTLPWDQLPEAQQGLFTKVAAHINSTRLKSKEEQETDGK
jgi:hypothetical protein